MKITTFCLSLALLGSTLAAEPIWHTDFKVAQAQAEKDQKSILLLFTGSDWCPPCMMLEKDVFSQKAFLDGISDQLVLSKVDFPRDENSIPKEQMDRAVELQEQYRVEGFPTVILTDHKGIPFALTGYEPGGAENYVTHLNGLLARKAAYGAMLKEAGKLEDLPKAAKLGEALQSLELSDFLFNEFYSEVIGDIELLDPQVTLPIHKSLKVAKKFYSMESALDALLDAGKPDEALSIVEDGIKDPEFNQEQRQNITFLKAVILMESAKYDQSLAALEACRAIDPDSEVAQSLDVVKQHIESLKSESAPTPPTESGTSPEVTGETPPADTVESGKATDGSQEPAQP